MIRIATAVALSVLVGLAAVPSRALNSRPSDGEILEEALIHGQGFDNLQHLTDAIGARLTGSDNLERAAAFAIERFKAYGLSNVHREEWRLPSTWERGRLAVTVVEPAARSLVAASMGWNLPTSPGGITGDVINIAVGTEKQLAALGPATHGKIGLLDLSGGGTEEFFNGFRSFPKRVAEAGLIAVVAPSSKTDRLCDTGWALGAEPVKTPFLSLAREDSQTINRLMAKGPVKLHIEMEDRIGPERSVPNIIADLPGTTKPDEYVILGGHLDSWDLATGATDDGAGAMAVLEAARTLAALGLKPERTIRFIMFTGEEQGFFGSLAYAKQHESELGKIQAVFVMDTGAGRARGVNLQGRKDLTEKAAEMLGPMLISLGLTDNRSDRAFVGCDNVPFTIRGVPAFTIEQDPKDYGTIHHAISDTLDKVKPEDLNFDAAVMAILATRVADSPKRLAPRLSSEQTAKMLEEAKLDGQLKAFGLLP
jgi:carboxypeptidase Q